MADRGLPVPTPKAVRANLQTKLKQRNLLRKTLQNKTPQRLTLQSEPRVVVVLVVPVDQLEDQAPFYPPNQPNQLPDIPPNQPDQQPNNPPNPQPPHQIYQINHLILQQIHLIQCSHKTLHPNCHN